MLTREALVKIIDAALLEKLYDDCPDWFPDTEEWAEQIVQAIEREDV